MNSILKMIKAAFSNYFKNIKFVFLIMGVIYVFLFFVISFVYIAFRNILIDSIGLLIAEIWQIASAAPDAVTFDNVLSGDFFRVLGGSLSDTLIDSFNTTVSSLITVLLIAVILMLLSFVLGGFLCRLSIRKSINKEETRRGFVAMLIRFFVAAVFTLILAVCIYYFLYSLFLLLALYLVFKAVALILEAKLIYFRDKKLKEMLTVKNIMLYVASSIVFFAVTLSFILLLWLTFNFFIAIAIGIPLIIYYTEIIRFTMVEYFRELFYK